MYERSGAMLTYLFLNVHRWRRRIVSFSVLLLLPLVLLFALYPFLKTTAEQTAVPIAIVDEDKTEFSQLLFSRLKDSNRLNVDLMSDGEAREAVQKGKVEGAFVLQAGLEEDIKKGRLSDIILWHRSNRSSLDVFAKEQLGSELMRLALNAKAANTIQSFGEDRVDWETAFQHSDDYWEPAPLFEMEYEAKSADMLTSSEKELHRGKKVLISLFFLYSWLLVLSFMKQFVIDRKEGTLNRILLSSQKLMIYYGAQMLIFILVGLIPFLLAINGLFFIEQAPSTQVSVWNLWGSIVFFVTILVSFLVFLLFQKTQGGLLVVGFIAISSFTLYVLPFDSHYVMDVLRWKVMPHGWLMDVPWNEGGQ